MLSKYVRGMVYWATIPRIADGVQAGKRPVIIVSNNVGNAFSDIMTILPCTTNTERATQATHIILNIFPNIDSLVLGEQIITINKNCLEGFIGLLDENTMKKIDEILKIALDLTGTPLVVKSKEPEIITKTKSKDKKNLSSVEAQQKFLEDFEKYGVDYILTEYNIASRAAAYQRKTYYKNKLTEQEK